MLNSRLVPPPIPSHGSLHHPLNAGEPGNHRLLDHGRSENEVGVNINATFEHVFVDAEALDHTTQPPFADLLAIKDHWRRQDAPEPSTNEQRQEPKLLASNLVVRTGPPWWR